MVTIQIHFVDQIHFYDNTESFYVKIYEGRSICNENSPVYPKVLYVHASKLLLLKGLFLG